MKSNSIKNWNEDDRPREKLFKKGPEVLTDAELLAIIIGSGVGKKSALDVAHDILEDNNYNLNTLGRLSPKRMMRYRGIGEAKAIGIAAAVELGKRRDNAEVKTDKITSSSDAYKALRSLYKGKTHEEFHIIMLNNANEIIRIHKMSQGGITGTVVDGKMIFKEALLFEATGIILSHNHPSGQLKPSVQDKTITTKLSEFGNFIDLRVLDHLIITDNGYFSFADEGLV